MKVIVVTGGTGGIGKAISIDLIKSNYKVAVLYKSNDAAAENLKQLANQNSDCIKLYKLAVTDYSSLTDCFADIEQTYGEISVLVNNAGIIRDNYLMIMKDEDWFNVINTNLLGVLNCTHAVLPYMKKRQQGMIINMSSIAGYIGISGQTNYSTTKAAIIGFTRALAGEVIKDNIYVYGIAPGYIQTEMLNSIQPNMMKKFIEAIPMKRVGEPAEVSMAVLNLIEKKFSYSTGQTFILDGGQGIV